MGTKTTFKFGARQRIYAGGKPLTAPDGDAHPLAVDWDGDGVLDLLVGCGDGSVLFCKGVRSSASGPPTLQAPVPLMAAGKPIKVGGRAKLCVCDWNNDGQLDLLIGDFEYKDSKDNKSRYIGNVHVFLRQP